MVFCCGSSKKPVAVPEAKNQQATEKTLLEQSAKKEEIKQEVQSHAQINGLIGQQEISLVVTPRSNLGIDFDRKRGVVVKVMEGSEAHKKGVENGMIMHKVLGKPYEQSLLEQCIGGNEPYEVTFLRQEAAAPTAPDSEPAVSLVDAPAVQEAAAPTAAESAFPTVFPTAGYPASEPEPTGPSAPPTVENLVAVDATSPTSSYHVHQPTATQVKDAQSYQNTPMNDPAPTSPTFGSVENQKEGSSRKKKQGCCC